MTIDAAFIPLLFIMAVVSFSSRAGGFWLMRFVSITPPLEAALRATPLAVMVGIVVPAAARGSLPELAALVAILISMRMFGNDLVSSLIGVTTVAILRITFA